MSLVGNKAFLLGYSRLYTWRESDNDTSLHNHCNDYQEAVRDIATNSEYQKINNVSVGKPDPDFQGMNDIGVVEYVFPLEQNNIMIPNIVLRSTGDSDIMFATRIEDLVFLKPFPGVNSIYKRTEFECNVGGMIIEYNFIQTEGACDTYGRLNFNIDGFPMDEYYKIYNDLLRLGDYTYIDRFTELTHHRLVNRFARRYEKIAAQSREPGTPEGDMKIEVYDDFGDIPNKVFDFIRECYDHCHLTIINNRHFCYSCNIATNQHYNTSYNSYKDQYLCRGCALNRKSKCSFCEAEKFKKHYLGDLFSDERFNYLKELLLEAGVENTCNSCLDHLFISCAKCYYITTVDINCSLDVGWDYLSSAHDKLIDNSDRYNGMNLCNTCYDTTLSNCLATPVNGFNNIEDHFPYTTHIHNINRYVSVESEVITPNDYGDDMHPVDDVWTPKNWRVVQDGSLNDGGVEFKNIRPVRGDYIEAGLLKLENASRDQDFWIDSSCGIHVHMDARDFRWRELRNLLMIINCIEPSIIESLPEVRRKSTYCKEIDKDYGQPIGNNYIYDSINNLRDLVNFSYRELSNVDPSEDKYNNSRYRGTNIHSRFFHGTIEFRYHEGSISTAPIVNWIHLCNNIMTAAKNLERNDKKWRRIKDMVLRDEHGLDVIKNIGGKSALKYIEDKIKRYEV